MWPRNKGRRKRRSTRVGVHKPWPTLAGWCTVGLLWVSGCTVGPDFVPPAAPPVDRYTAGAEPTATISANEETQRSFSSPKLDLVIQEALSNNATLQAAQASLRQSQERLKAGFGVFYPQADAGFDATRQKFSPARFGQSSQGSIFSLYTLEGTVSYTLDVFGGERRAVEGLQSQVDFQRYAVLAAYLTLSGNVVNAVVAGAAYRALIESTQELIDLEKEQIRLAEIQAQAGTVPYSDVLSLRTQLSATEATLAPLRQNVSQTEHLLAILTGRVPAQWAPPQVDLKDLKLPGDLPVTLPSNLVRQRPDILVAEAQLHGASAQIGVATAALFPSFTLSGTYGVNNNSIENLFNKSSTFWSLGGSVLAPLFHGGTLWYERRAAIEGYEQSLAVYRQTVLAALGQVAHVLRALEHDAQALRAQSQAVDTSEEVMRLVQDNYRAGIANYLQVLIANAQNHQARIGYVQASALRLQDTVALFVALGGGWWNMGEKPLHELTQGVAPSPDAFPILPRLDDKKQ